MTDGALLTVAELQQGYRDLLRNARAGRSPATRRLTATGDLSPSRGNRALEADPDGTAGSDIPADWIAVIAAHAGAGASTVALALADAAADDGRPAHLIEAAGAARSGLAAAARSELGVDPTGCWRTGRRAGVTIDRRAGETKADWPTPHAGAQVTIVDLGLPTPNSLDRLSAGGTSCVVVCRATVPAVRSAERTLDALTAVPVTVAVLGPGRWPGEVTSSLGPRLRHLRADGRVIAVPVDPSPRDHRPLPDTTAQSRSRRRPVSAAAGRHRPSRRRRHLTSCTPSQRNTSMSHALTDQATFHGHGRQLDSSCASDAS